MPFSVTQTSIKSYLFFLKRIEDSNATPAHHRRFLRKGVKFLFGKKGGSFFLLDYKGKDIV